MQKSHEKSLLGAAGWPLPCWEVALGTAIPQVRGRVQRQGPVRATHGSCQEKPHGVARPALPSSGSWPSAQLCDPGSGLLWTEAAGRGHFCRDAQGPVLMATESPRSCSRPTPPIPACRHCHRRPHPPEASHLSQSLRPPPQPCANFIHLLRSTCHEDRCTWSSFRDFQFTQHIEGVRFVSPACSGAVQMSPDIFGDVHTGCGLLQLHSFSWPQGFPPWCAPRCVGPVPSPGPSRAWFFTVLLSSPTPSCPPDGALHELRATREGRARVTWANTSV